MRDDDLVDRPVFDVNGLELGRVREAGEELTGMRRQDETDKVGAKELPRKAR
ncbi:MAG: hypothetical protein QOE90_2628 [Thermoplasmata archaeon]|jgi:hypothetical protein|nr:hypothetical protein [Thermoplasmata archaeon]